MRVETLAVNTCRRALPQALTTSIPVPKRYVMNGYIHIPMYMKEMAASDLQCL